MLTGNACPGYTVWVSGTVLCALCCVVGVWNDLVRLRLEADIAARVLQGVGTCMSFQPIVKRFPFLRTFCNLHFLTESLLADMKEQ